MTPEGAHTIRDGLAQGQDVFGGGGDGNLARLAHHLPQHRQQKLVFAAHVVEQRRLVDASLGGEFARAGLGDAVTRQHPNRRL